MAESAKDEIRIMGHHLFHLFYCFSGRDCEERIVKLIQYFYRESQAEYGSQFIENFNNLLRKIANNPEIRIRLVSELDDICEKCPKPKVCGGPNDMDVAVIGAFDCEVNEVYTVKELIKKGFGLLRPNLREVVFPQRNKLPEWQRDNILFKLCGFLHNWGVYDLDENLLETK